MGGEGKRFGMESELDLERRKRAQGLSPFSQGVTRRAKFERRGLGWKGVRVRGEGWHVGWLEMEREHKMTDSGRDVEKITLPALGELLDHLIVIHPLPTSTYVPVLVESCFAMTRAFLSASSPCPLYTNKTIAPSSLPATDGSLPLAAARRAQEPQRSGRLISSTLSTLIGGGARGGG